jgi:predicted DNA-binding transcriptional regulator AlpA
MQSQCSTAGPKLGGDRESGDPDASFTIDEFCRVEKISRAFYYKLKKQGRGPREMKLGPGAKRISGQARRDWHRQREAEAAESAA